MERYAGPSVGLTLLVCVLASFPSPSVASVPAGPPGALPQLPVRTHAPVVPEFVNFSDNASNWTTDFYSVTWPAGPFSSISLTVALANFGDPWDRAEWIDVNNVTLMDLTTLENSSGNNPLQTFSANVTEYEGLFGGPGHVWWQAMPDWIAACSSFPRGCWSGILSFEFAPGPAPPGLPTVVPVLPFATLTVAAPAVHGTLRAAGSFVRAEAAVFQEGQSTDEFWYVQPFASRELLWQWDNQTVLANLPLPFINSGGALGGINDLAEWNGTPAPGTGSRPAVIADLTPWIALLEQHPWYNFTVVDNGNYWQIGLALLLWNSTDAVVPGAASSSVNRTLGSRAGAIEGQATATSSEPFASRQYDLNWSEYLNTTGSSFDVAAERVAVERISSASVSLVRTSVVRTVFDIRVDSGGAVHVLFDTNWTNVTTVTGNAQAAALTHQESVVWAIDGASGGLASSERRNATGSAVGNYSAPPASFAGGSGWYANRTSSRGVGTSAAPSFVSWGGAVIPMPGRFVVAPLAGSVVRGPFPVELLSGPGSAGGARATLGNETWTVPANDTIVADRPSLVNGSYELNVTSETDAGPAEVGVPLRVTGWSPPYVAPLTPTASAAASVGEAPWVATFNGSTVGGTPPYAWTWEFGDGTTGAGPNTTHEYPVPGFYAAVLQVTDSRHVSARATLGVQVLPPLTVTLNSSRNSWSVGSRATLTATVVGGYGPMRYSWGPVLADCGPSTSETLPCEPSAAGFVSVPVSVTDSLGYAARAWFNTTVAPPPAIQGDGVAPLAVAGAGVVAAFVGVGAVLWRLRRRRGRA